MIRLHSLVNGITLVQASHHRLENYAEHDHFPLTTPNLPFQLPNSME